MEEKKFTKEEYVALKEELEKTIEKHYGNASEKKEVYQEIPTMNNDLKQTKTMKRTLKRNWGYVNTVLLGLVFVVSMVITTFSIVTNILD